MNAGGRIVAVAGRARDAVRLGGGRPATAAEAELFDRGVSFPNGRAGVPASASPVMDLSADTEPAAVPPGLEAGDGDGDGGASKTADPGPQEPPKPPSGEEDDGDGGASKTAPAPKQAKRGRQRRRHPKA